jgi:KaiC/GvpD/RAD55 family RecA-like ATPase
MMADSYYRVCTSLRDKGTLVKEGTDLDKYTKGEAYISAFKYNEEHKKLFEKNGSVAGITDVTTDIIYFDLDNEDIEVSRKDTIEVVNRLSNYGISSNQMKICLSGNKGFHISIHTTETFTPEEAKSLAIKLAGDLPSFDSSIYNSNRIIRLEGSLHKKTGLRKTPISFDELQTLKIADIKSLATTSYAYDKPVKVKPTEAFMKLTEPITERKKEDELTLDSGVDYLSNPYKLQPWKLAISQGFFPNGSRSNALMILGATLMNKGLLKEQCYYALKAAADLQSDRYGKDKFSKEEIWEKIVEQVYKPTWNGGSYSEDNFPVKLQEYFEELGIPRKEYSDVASEVVRIEDKFDDFVQYASDIDKYTMKFGIPSLDSALKVRKGHLIGLLAGPGIGKTSFGITLLNNCSKAGSNCFFASMDMYSLNVYQKLIQRHTGYTEEEMFEFFKKKDQHKIEEFRKVLKDNYGNVSFSFKSGMSISELKKSISMEEDKLGDKLDLVLVDYLELIQTDKTDPTASSAEAINGLREIANEGRVVVVLLQPNKISSKPDQPLLSYNSAKGSSMIAQAVTAMLTAHRPGYSSENPENDKFFSVNVVKNRNGALFQRDFNWHGQTQTISEMDDDDRFALSVLRDTKKDVEDDF